MKRSLPDLSRFEIECLRRLWSRGEASIRLIHNDLPDGPSYSTVRKIFERLEAKGAVELMAEEIVDLDGIDSKRAAALRIVLDLERVYEGL